MCCEGLSHGCSGVERDFTLRWAAPLQVAVPGSVMSQRMPTTQPLWHGAAHDSIADGIGNDLFGVGNKCTRAQIVMFLWKLYAGKQLLSM